jgi:glucose/arabinose dehydrogenase
LLINDVGGNFEEINRGQAGANYGWPTVEHGPSNNPQFVDPIHIYPQSSIGGSVFIPHTSSWPSQYHGQYLFADFVQGWIRMLHPGQAPSQEAAPFASGLRRPVDLRLGADDGLYVLLRNAWVIDGKFQPGTSSLLKVTFGISVNGP